MDINRAHNHSTFLCLRQVAERIQHGDKLFRNASSSIVRMHDSSYILTDRGFYYTMLSSKFIDQLKLHMIEQTTNSNYKMKKIARTFQLNFRRSKIEIHHESFMVKVRKF